MKKLVMDFKSIVHQSKHIFKKNSFIFILFERVTDTDLLPVGLLPRCLQHLDRAGLGQSQEPGT